MNNLSQKLHKETQQLKSDYITLTKRWANDYFNFCEKRLNWDKTEWANFIWVWTRIVNPWTRMEFIDFESWKDRLDFTYSNANQKYRKYKEESEKTVKLWLDWYIKKEIDKAIKHYEDSLTKLIDKIYEFWLIENNIIVKSAYMWTNIDITISDWIQEIHAYTIIAEGTIQRPHYRYLIKKKNL